MFLLWVLCGSLFVLTATLCIKIYGMKKGMKEIGAQLGEHLRTDTNTLLFVSTRDRHVRELAAALNVQLRQLRKQRQKYLGGDRALTEAVTNISHDLRTPLTAICGYLHLLKQEELPCDAARYLSLIENRTQALIQLTEELFRYSFTLSDEGEMSLVPVNLGNVLEESVAAFYAAFTQKGITPRICMPKEPVIRSLDKAALSRIFENLLGNALKYSDGGLDIRLCESGEIRFTNPAAGLDEVQVGRFFERFFSVAAAKNSSGLGLSIAKVLTVRLGGTIDASYEEGMLTVAVKFRG